jgi:hypothetical protein
MTEIQNQNVNNNGKLNPSDEQYLSKKIEQIKENSLSQISPIILIKPAIFSFFVLIFSMFVDISTVPVLGNITIDIAKHLYPNWQPAEQAVQPIQFWWLPLVSYLFFISISIKEYKGLFSHVRATTPRENIDRIISSSISLIDGYSTALPLIGAAFLLVSIKLGPEIFLGLSVPFEIKALIVLAIAKLFEPVLDYIGVKFQKVINVASDFQEQFYQKMQVKQTEKLIKILSENNSNQSSVSPLGNNVSVEYLKSFREELEKIKALSFDSYQNFNALNKLAAQLNVNLENNDKHLTSLNQLSQSIDSMASNLSNEKVAQSLNSLELIVNKR